MKKIIDFKEVISQYNDYYQTNVKSFRYANTEELDEIICEVFDLDCKYIEYDWDNNIIEIYL